VPAASAGPIHRRTVTFLVVAPDERSVGDNGARRLCRAECRRAGPRGIPITETTVVETEPDGLDRLVTVPNAITLARLACIPIFLWLLFGVDRQTGAAVLLAVLGATDWVDGYVARRFGQVSTLGKVLDPVADRVLVLTAVVAIMVKGAVPLWFGAATLAREAVVSAAVLLLASLGASRIDVLWVGKAGTFALMFSYPAFLLGNGTATWQEPIRAIAWVTGIVGLVLAWIAAASYVPLARRALAQGRRGRNPQGAR
jgi:cardiolipin synthase (CMP-forming)